MSHMNTYRLDGSSGYFTGNRKSRQIRISLQQFKVSQTVIGRDDVGLLTLGLQLPPPLGGGLVDLSWTPFKNPASAPANRVNIWKAQSFQWD